MSQDDAPRLGIGIIGCGRVGASIGAAWRQAGHAIIGVSATSAASLERAEEMLPAVPVLDPDEITERAELVLVAVPDDEIAPLVTGLADLGRIHAGQILVHCSGRYGTDVLDAGTRLGALPIALHPSLTFTGTEVDLSRLRQATIAVTAPAPIRPVGEALVVELGAEPIDIAEADRPLYHAAITHASNHSITVLAEAMELLSEAGVADPSAVLHALVDASVANTMQNGPKALTGPISRGDVGTIEAHLAALSEFSLSRSNPSVRNSYIALARSTAAKALAMGRITEAQAQQILTALD
ncbi:Rossmann-like and DUF2520 domain-containing protein [Brevibacterium linens]|uniref:Predicted oxidoreductase, contains short-chain dehydrogenase (SDR) and DUF2520 domains n=1 Tax=Brevibacterium linens ATCC 9172 TaxID=1255617 RepID=A0A2H1K8H9_BRELN|nr:DUF2520 domain-containing protein [Brevibacterium linens]AZU00050.1 DUF2520 domain-containing protein [Brevibacterium linens]KAB1946225.1 DUF2520 domain-containing protein [Brevibacterium linens ATCC 9172]SMX96071.1 Predicted oxidoreductase, contains short-chain dehydrogenase (SDR) and DUF2520 domains [Brevibacterium linens ATCC 9172]